ncbi:MAG: GTP-binding protein [Anaerolineae bacterium]|nr:GTP-binding protein [Anaerolineae bacterium]
MNLPSRLQDARRFIETLDLQQIEASVADEARAQLVIVGPVNSGKSTLFNRLKGQKLSPVSAVPGTTRQLVSERFGPFALVDTPGLDEIAGAGHAATALQAVEHATVVILVFDAAAGVRQSDANLLREIASTGLSVVVALNKIDLIRRDLKQVLRDIELKLGVPVIPISAKKDKGIADQLIPAIIESHPRMAVTVGRALPRYRKIASARVVRESAAIAVFMGVEPIPLVSLPFLIAVQVRMLLRLAAIYGQAMGVARARELLSAIAGGLAIRYTTQELAKLIPGPGWLIAGGAAWTGTNALGRAAIVFFESSQKLSARELRDIYKRLRWRVRQPDVELIDDDEHS